MSKCLLCAAAPMSGLRHRFVMLSSIKYFADRYGYSVRMLWGITTGVAYRQFQELFAPVPGISVTNVTAQKLTEVANCAKSGRSILFGNQLFRAFRPGGPLPDNVFSWDLAGCGDLARLIPGRPPQVVASPSPAIRAQALAYIRAHRVGDRLGIRVRVEEYRSRNRKPRRVMRELDEVVKSIVRVPWYTQVFLATDSEYVQQMLASHFTDVRFLFKKFDLQEPTGRYVHRQDRDAMFTFLKEVDCLCHCKRIINVGGFLNERSVEHKILEEPYEEAAHLNLIRR
jgi:hypothetical protein